MSASELAHRMRRVLIASILLCAGIGIPAAAQAASPEPVRLPPGWTVVSAESLGRGADHFTLTRADGPVVAHVVRAARHELSLRAVVSHDRIGGPSAAGERTSSMCVRLGCIAAVNADFARVGTDQPVGAVVSAGRVLRSPVATHHQFSVGWGPLMASGGLEWRARLVSSDLREIAVAGLNDPNNAEGAVLFTPAWGPSLSRGPEHTALALRFVGGTGELVPATTATVEMIDVLSGSGELALAPGTAALRATGEAGAALRDLWERASRGETSRRALIRVEIGPDARESVGGTPVLVRDGRAWVQNDGTGFVSGRHPRTAAGWDAAGRVLLVTVDGRQPAHSVGMTLPELAEFLVGVGAVEALNLDGGGSTTMVVAGQVVNLPSDRLVRRGGIDRLAPIVLPGDDVVGNVERPVSVGLLLVPNQVAPPAAAVAAPDPMADDALVPPSSRELQLALPAGDAGSDPSAGAMPALLPVVQPDRGGGLSPTWVALALLLQLLVASTALGQRGRLFGQGLIAARWGTGTVTGRARRL